MIIDGVKFFGSIAFLDSIQGDRTTFVSNFETISDWFKSVVDYYQGAVNCGDYDGTEILVNVYVYNGKGDGKITASDYDSDKLVATKYITNPYYQG